MKSKNGGGEVSQSRHAGAGSANRVRCSLDRGVHFFVKRQRNGTKENVLRGSAPKYPDCARALQRAARGWSRAKTLLSPPQKGRRKMRVHYGKKDDLANCCPLNPKASLPLPRIRMMVQAPIFFGRSKTPYQIRRFGQTQNRQTSRIVQPSRIMRTSWIVQTSRL